MSAARGTIVFDLDGVLYVDSEGVPGAGAALERLAAGGWLLRYATNNSTKTPGTVVDHIAERTGFRADPAEAVTSAMSAASHLAGAVSRAAVVGSDAIAEELEKVGIETVDLDADPEAVIVGLDRSLTYDTIDRAARAVCGGARLVATNTDATYPTPTGLAPGAGTIVAAIETASGVTAESCGKPADVFGVLVDSRIRRRPVVMVGDRPETDIALGQSRGWTTVLTLTGVTDDPGAVSAEYRPDHVIGSVSELPALLDAMADRIRG